MAAHQERHIHVDLIANITTVVQQDRLKQLDANEGILEPRPSEAENVTVFTVG